jgi:hypothetical protein
MKQIPANTNDASTGHKLQGMSKDVIIVTSWPTWPSINVQKLVVCCSILCAHIKGLYLVESINMEKSFKPSEQLRSYIEYARKQETILLEKQKNAMSQFNWM